MSNRSTSRTESADPKKYILDFILVTSMLSKVSIKKSHLYQPNNAIIYIIITTLRNSNHEITSLSKRP